MPVIKGAIRKLRADKRKTGNNRRVRKVVGTAVWKMRKKPTPTNLKAVFGALDRAAGKGVISKNKASRLKSRLSRLVRSR